MLNDDVIIQGVHANIGDARVTFYKIIQNFSDYSDLQLSHSHYYYEYHLITSGNGHFSVSGAMVAVQQGECIIFPPGMEHCPLESTGHVTEMVLALVLEKSEGERGYFTYFQNSLNACAAIPLPLQDALQNRITAFFHRFEKEIFRERFTQQVETYNILYELFENINHLKNTAVTSHQAHQEEKEELKLEYLINELSFTLTDIAAKLGYTPRHTARLIRNKYGKSLGEIRQNDMIVTAKELLCRKPPLTLQTIAMQSGFSGVKALNRAFQRLEGISPTEYRKNMYLLHSIK